MVKRATSLVFAMLLATGMLLNIPAKAQVATPSQAVITVSGVPDNTTSLAVEVTVDSSVITLGSPSTSVSGALGISGGNGVGVVATSGNLPSSLTITVPLTGVAAGTSMITIGAVKDTLAGTGVALTGATAVADISSVTVASSSTTTSTSGTTGSGTLSTDTFTIMVSGEAVKQTSALNVTVAFGDSSIAVLDTGVTVSGTGISSLLTDVNTTTNLLSAVWSGTSTDGTVTITGMLKPGTMGGTTSIGVAKVEAAGGLDITSSVATTIDPTSITNGSGSSSSGTGSFSLIGPSSATGPGKVAVSFSATGAPSGITATLNGSKVEFASGNTVGTAIVDISSGTSVPLSLVVKAGGTTSTVSLGSITVTQGTGKKVQVKTASANNKAAKTNLSIAGMGYVKDATTVTIVPTNRAATTTTVMGASIKASYAASECIPKGSYVNVSTAAGTNAKKIKVRGACSNTLP